MEYEDNEAGREERSGGGRPDPGKRAVIDREAPEMNDNRENLVSKWCGRVRGSKQVFAEDFKRMRDDMALAREGAVKEWADRGDYVANIVQRHLAGKVAALYARDPKAEWKRRPRLDFAIWDGTPQHLEAAQQMLGAEDPQARTAGMAVIHDVLRGKEKKRQMARVGETLATLFHYFINEQTPKFKTSMKQAVRRATTTGVSYIEVGYQRLMERTPEDQRAIEDASRKLTHLQTTAADVEDNVIDASSAAEIEELRLQVAELQKRPKIVIREGLVFNFHRSTRVIVDPNCSQLKQGFPGARWVAVEMLMMPEEIRRVYKVDVSSGYMAYNINSVAKKEDDFDDAKKGTSKRHALVWKVWDRQTGLVYHICDGYKDFLAEPNAPDFEVEGFFPIIPLVFNDIEDEAQLYPMSDVYQLRHPQAEYNRSRQSLREHRTANRPKYVSPKGALEDSELKSLGNHPAHAIIELSALQQGQKSTDLLQPVQTIGVDPNLYETNSVFEDFQRVGGAQEANLGGTSGATATEASLAEGSRISGIESNKDDLDDVLSEVAQMSGQVMLQVMPSDLVKEIAGPGAAWPDWSLKDIQSEIYLQVQAGSTGKPNKVQELQNWQQLAPILMQIPGVPPNWMMKETLRRLDDKLDIEEAYIEGLPSIQSMNAPQQGAPGGGGPDAPAAQGPEGANNAPGVQQSGPLPGPNLEAGPPASAAEAVMGALSGGGAAGRGGDY